jgi:hypothetical protein
MFLKEKRCGKIKGRGCADGCKQREYLSKEDTSSPTVAIESVFLSCVIDVVMLQLLTSLVHFYMLT